MTHDRLQWLKLRVRRLWILSPEKLWLASIAAHRRGHLVLAFWLKQLNGFLYHNSLAPGASVGRDIFLGHNSLGIVISPAVEIGSAVVIWHNVTLIAGRPERHLPPEAQAALEPDAQASSAASPLGRIIVEDGVRIGANAVLIAPRAQTLRIGRGAFIGVNGGSLAGRRVLDLGCNAGYWSLAAIEAGADFVLGIDGRQMHIDQANLVFEARGVDPARYSFQTANIFDHDFGGEFHIVL